MATTIPLKFICEDAHTNYDFIVEQKNASELKKLKIKGPFLVAEKRNGNGRMYSRSILETAVKEYTRDYIAKGKALGEINHPKRNEVDFNEACIKITEIKQSDLDPNVFEGEAIVLASDPAHGIKGTPKGDIVASLLQYGVKPGISSRGYGHLNEDKVVDTYYKLVAMDLVTNPSGPNCYVNGIMESKEFMLSENGEIFEVPIKNLEKNLSSLPLNSELRLEKLRSAWKQFMEDITHA